MNTNTSFHELSARWREEKKKYVKPATYSTYVMLLEKHILPVFSGSCTIREEQVQVFVLQKLSAGMGRRTVQNILIVLKTILRFGARKGLCEEPAWTIRFPTLTVKNGISVLSPASQRKILGTLDIAADPRNLGIILSLTAGLRIGEVCALQWKDLDTREGTIHIYKTVERIYDVDAKKRRTHLQVGPPKTADSVRSIPIERELLRQLRPLAKRHSPEDYALTGTGRPMEPRTYRYFYKRLLQQLGLPATKYHSLRHSVATRCIESGCDYKTVSVLLGHASITTTLDLYVHPGMKQKQDCIEKMSRSIRRDLH